jgi:hypothetical protein
MRHYPQPGRDFLEQPKYLRFLAFFWAYLVTICLLSLWT